MLTLPSFQSTFARSTLDEPLQTLKSLSSIQNGSFCSLSSNVTGKHGTLTRITQSFKTCFENLIWTSQSGLIFFNFINKLLIQRLLLLYFLFLILSSTHRVGQVQDNSSGRFGVIGHSITQILPHHRFNLGSIMNRNLRGFVDIKLEPSLLDISDEKRRVHFQTIIGFAII